MKNEKIYFEYSWQDCSKVGMVGELSTATAEISEKTGLHLWIKQVDAEDDEGFQVNLDPESAKELSDYIFAQLKKHSIRIFEETGFKV